MNSSTPAFRMESEEQKPCNPVTWADWHHLNPCLFPSLTELSQDESGAGMLLKNIPEWIVREADRWPEPWEYLGGAPELSEFGRNVCRAAQSTIPALQRIARIVLGIATNNTDWGEELKSSMKEDNAKATAHAEKKVSTKLGQYKKFQKQAKSLSVDAAIREECARRLRLLQRNMVRHGKKAEFDSPKKVPTNHDVHTNAKIEAFVATHWLRFHGAGGKVPGLMFFSIPALATMISWRFRMAVTSNDSVKKMRQRLGLLPVIKPDPFVWSVKIDLSYKTPFVEGFCRRGERIFRHS